ncbi:zinc finger CCCH domain-containing protein 19-like [Dorcoceras hygrometricum]|uniref:Zinc finger CCCH domain-containing protein 19-like n=1 Tax=Dorcoceras hygrometricum TaxID=472368 RepID=A0A2Z7CEN8_9LAMI|nr:zinc finger CCCH domain-containing protein 19-like [Dorcoceras hygrometricum]
MRPKAGTDLFKQAPVDWLRKTQQKDDASTNLNDSVKVTSASLLPAGHTVTTHSSQQFSCGWYQTQHLKRSVSTYQNDVVSQLCDWFQNSMHNPPLLDSTCATVNAMRHFLIDSCNCAHASSSNHHKHNN